MGVLAMNEPVCRNCGSDEIHSIEQTIEWRYVDWVYQHGEPERQVENGIIPAVKPGWVTGDQWGDEVGDSSSESVGVACGNCNVEIWFEKGQVADDLITTRGAYNRAHPVRRWRVKVRRLVEDAVYGPTTITVGLPDGTTTEREVPYGKLLKEAVYEDKTVVVKARDEREALARSAEHGMNGPYYPWQPVYPPAATLLGKAS